MNEAEKSQPNQTSQGNNLDEMRNNQSKQMWKSSSSRYLLHLNYIVAFALWRYNISFFARFRFTHVCEMTSDSRLFGSVVFIPIFVFFVCSMYFDCVKNAIVATLFYANRCLQNDLIQYVACTEIPFAIGTRFFRITATASSVQIRKFRKFRSKCE